MAYSVTRAKQWHDDFDEDFDGSERSEPAARLAAAQIAPEQQSASFGPSSPAPSSVNYRQAVKFFAGLGVGAAAGLGLLVYFVGPMAGLAAVSVTGGLIAFGNRVLNDTIELF